MKSIEQTIARTIEQNFTKKLTSADQKQHDLHVLNSLLRNKINTALKIVLDYSLCDILFCQIVIFRRIPIFLLVDNAVVIAGS